MQQQKKKNGDNSIVIAIVEVYIVNGNISMVEVYIVNGNISMIEVYIVKLAIEWWTTD
eukprot:Pgem_evm1s9926